MGKFRKTIKKSKKSSCSIDEKISLLNKELAKTGMLGEQAPANSTSNMYTQTQFIPYIPETQALVPDSSGVSASGWTQPGDETDTDTWDESDFANTTLYKDMSYLFNPNELNGQANREILDGADPTKRAAANAPAGAGLVINGNYYGTAVGYIGGGQYHGVLSGGLTGGTNKPTEESRGYGGYYRGLTDEQFAHAVSMWNTWEKYIPDYYAGNLVTKSVRVWVPYNRHHHYQRGGEYATWTGGPKSGGMILENVGLIIARNSYQNQDTEHAKTIVLQRISLGDPSYYPGDPANFLKKLLDLGDRAWDYLQDKIRDWIDPSRNTFGGVPSPFNPIVTKSIKDVSNTLAEYVPLFHYAMDMAKSIVTNEVQYGDHSERNIKTFVDNLNPNLISNEATSDNVQAGVIPVNTTKQSYSDKNFYVHPVTGAVIPHDQESLEQYPPNAAQHDYKPGVLGVSNPIAAHGESQVQIVVGPDGKPRLVVTDWAYLNTNNPDDAKPWQAAVAKVLSFGRQPGDGSMNTFHQMDLEGATHYEFEVPYEQWPERFKEVYELNKPKTSNTSDNNQSNVNKIEEPSVSPQTPTVDDQPFIDNDNNLQQPTRSLRNTQQQSNNTQQQSKWVQPDTEASNQAFWGGKTQEVDPTKRQGRGSHINIINYYNSGGSMGKMPEGWTQDDVNEYIRNLNNGTLQQSSQGSSGDVQIAGMTNYERGLIRSGQVPYMSPTRARQLLSDPEIQKLDDPLIIRQLQRLMVKRGEGRTQVAHYEPQGELIKEDISDVSSAWASPKHVNIDKNERKRWFNTKDIQPLHPKKENKIVNGYHADSKLAPQKVDKDPAIKITEKDILRNHKLSDHEKKEWTDTIKEINEFLAAHPEELIHARQRYPKNDPKLAELNWKLDQKLNASEKYMDSHFPENTRLFNKITKATNKTIQLTDPEYIENHYNEIRGTIRTVQDFNDYGSSKKKKISKINRKSPARFFKKPKQKSTSDIIDEKIRKLEKDSLI